MHSICLEVLEYNKYAFFSLYIKTLKVPRTHKNMTYFVNFMYSSLVPKYLVSKDMFSVYFIVQDEQRDVDS